MHRFFTTGIVSLLLSSVVAGVLFVPTTFVLAQGIPGIDPGATGLDSPPAQKGYAPDGKGGSPTAPQNGKSKLPSEPPQTKGCVAYSGLGIVPSINLDGCVALIANLGMWLAARTLWVSGALLNITLERTLNMSSLLHDLPIVDIGWKVIRDVSNIVFIFIALWCGISITLGLKAEQAWGFLAQMVLVAIFINFSLFITKAVVDASNIAALHFYNLIAPAEHRQGGDAGLSEAFMQGLRLQTIYNPNSLNGGGKQANTTSLIGGGINMLNIILMGLFGSVLMLVAAFVFFAASIMFVLRGITLIMLMLLSPLAFVSWLLPGASGLASAWWNKLWSQAFFAPLYLLLSYIVVYTINSDAFQQSMSIAANSGTQGFAAALTGTTSAPLIIVFNFIILIGLMVGCLIVAQSLGARGSDLMMEWGHKLKGEGTGLVGRHAMQGFGLGHLGEKWQEKNAAKMADDKHVGLFSKIGAGALKYTSMRNLNERLSQTPRGNTAVGKFFREQTTGRMADAKFGGSKSAEEAYEESEHDASVRRAIGHINVARRAGEKLHPLRTDQRQHQIALADARKNVTEAENASKLAQTANPNPVEVAAAEKALTDAKADVREIEAAQKELDQANVPAGNVTAAEQELERAKVPAGNVTVAEQELERAKVPAGNVTVAEQELERAERKTPEIEAAEKRLAEEKADLATDPNNKIFQGFVENAQKKLDAEKAKQAPAIATAQQGLDRAKQAQQVQITAAEQKRDLAKQAQQVQITAAEQKLELAKQAQQVQITAAEQELERATKEHQSRVTLAGQSLATAQEPTQAQKDALRRWTEYKDAKEKFAKNPTDQAAKAAIASLEPQLSSEYHGLAKAEKAMEEAEKELKEFNVKNQGAIDQLVNKMSTAFAKLTPQEYIELTPKDDHFKPELVDYGVLPASFVRALAEDEHALTEGEKQEMIHARVKRLVEDSKRGETRKQEYNARYIEYQTAVNREDSIRNALPSQMSLSGMRKEQEYLREILAELKRGKKKGGSDLLY
ncbi:MAG: hypothetical protein EXS51_00010 [Candidatus Taylorbacteria bacterium]|nr:hypothetical protein [Candidatus Taylorbacteria bacterium]